MFYWQGLDLKKFNLKGLYWQGFDWKIDSWKGLDWKGLETIVLERIGLEDWLGKD